jgi:hypothetical protein
MDRIRCCLLFLIASASSVLSQDADSLLTNALDKPFTAEDSLSIFNLIDSLLAIDNAQSSQLAARIGYNSNVLSLGRTLGINNFGLAPGLTYYHKSGLYADVTGYWSNKFSPNYYLTVASAGYMHDFSKWFSVMAEYDRYFYSAVDANSYVPYRNTISVTPILEKKPISLMLNYAFYFGDQTAHRFMPGVSVTLQKRNLWLFNRIAVMPSFYLLWGNQVINTIDYVPPKNFLEAIQNFKQYGTRYKIVETSKNEFGLMNYAISVPLSASVKKWILNFTYTYSIPQALPSEPVTLSESTYLSGSLTYLINLKRKKNTLQN